MRLTELRFLVISQTIDSSEKDKNEVSNLVEGGSRLLAHNVIKIREWQGYGTNIESSNQSSTT